MNNSTHPALGAGHMASTGDQVNSLLKCIEYRLLTSQKKIVKALKEEEKRQA